MKQKRICAIFMLITLLFSCIGSFIPMQVEAKNNPVKYIFIGDSRFVGVAQDVKGLNKTGSGGNGSYVNTKKGNEYWLASVGVSQSNWTNSTWKIGNKTFKKVVEGTLDKYKDKKKDITIIYELGVNNPDGIQTDISYCNTLVNNGWTVYMCDLLPIDDAKAGQGMNQKVTDANATIDEKAGKYTVIKYASNVDIKKADSLGYHYDADTHKGWYGAIISSVSGSKGSTTTNSDGTTTITGASESAEFKKNLKACLGYEPSDNEVYNYSMIISALKADGETDNAIAGILGNILHEGSKIYAIEGYGGKKTKDDKTYGDFEPNNSYEYTVKPAMTPTKSGTIGGIGHGIVQWSFERADKLFKFAKDNSDSNGFKYVTVKHYFWCSYIGPVDKWDTAYIPDIVGQTCFMVIELNADYKSVKDAINKASSADSACEIFCNKYEAPGINNMSDRKASAKKAVDLVKSHTGTIGSTSADGNKDEEGNMAEMLVKNGYWNESQLSAYIKLSEINIDEEWLKDATSNNLTGSELGSVTNWRKNKDAMQEESNLIRVMRISLQVIGIFLAIWSMLIYIAYWVDRLNSFIEIDFVSLLTFDKLMISEDESECTFKIRNLGKGGKKTINHQAVIAISAIGLAFATLLFTGLLFRFVALLVIKILELFGQ